MTRSTPTPSPQNPELLGLFSGQLRTELERQWARTEEVMMQRGQPLALKIGGVCTAGDAVVEADDLQFFQAQWQQRQPSERGETGGVQPRLFIGKDTTGTPDTIRLTLRNITDPPFVTRTPALRNSRRLRDMIRCSDQDSECAQ